MSNSQFDLNKDQWLAHHTAIYGRHLWPAQTLMAVMTRTSVNDAMFKAGVAQIADGEAVWRLIEDHAGRGRDTWISVAGLDPSVRDGTSRGSKDKVVGLPGLVADIDFADAIHAVGDANPTRVEAKAWVDTFSDVIDPTVVNHSGGGAHIWVATAELLDWRNVHHQELLHRWKEWWMQFAADSSRRIDAGPLNNPAGLLRPAGSYNAKQGKSVRTTREIGQRILSVEELLDILPPVAPRTTVLVSPAPVRAVANKSSGDEENRRGDRLARQIPVAAFCVSVFNAHYDARSSLTFPRLDGSRAPDANARVYPATDESPERVTVFGERVLAELGLAPNQSLTSFDFLALICGDGTDRNYKGAARLLRATEVDGQWGEAFMTAVNGIVSGEQSLAGILSASEALSVRDALDGGQDTEIALENDLLVRVASGFRHGLFKRAWEKTENGDFVEVAPKRVVSWVGWKRGVVRHLSVDPSGDVYEVTPASYTCQIVDSRGRNTIRSGFSSKEAHDPKHILNEMDPGVTLPDSPSGVRHVEAMLRALGRHDSMEDTSEFHTLGWMKDPDTGSHVYLAPAGSVNAHGPVNTYAVGAPANSQEGAGTAAAKAIGYPTIPNTQEGIREGAAAIRGFLDIVPDRMDIGVALLGIIFAAPLALSRRTTVFIVADPDSGKTMLIGAAQAFITGDPTSSSFTGGPAGLDSAVAAQVKTSWLRHATGFWDDYAMTDDQHANTRIKSLAENVIRLTYGSDGQTGGTQSGGVRSTRTAETCSVFTGEGTPTGQGIVSRLIRIVLRKGEVALSPKGTSAYDTFITQHAPKARELFGAYLQSLAGRLDEVGLTMFRQENDELKRTWLSESEGRTAETVAVLGAGWMRLREFARANGCEDLLPNKDEVNAALESLIGENVGAVTEANPAATIIDRVRDKVLSREAYVDTHDGEPPRDSIARQLGWQRELVYVGGDLGHDEVWKPASRFRAGVLSPDRQWVVITNDAITKIKAANGMQAVPQDQIRRAAKAFVVAGTDPGDRAPRDMFPGRQRGWVVPSSVMDIDTEPPSVEPSTEPAIPDTWREVFEPTEQS